MSGKQAQQAERQVFGRWIGGTIGVVGVVALVVSFVLVSATSDGVAVTHSTHNRYFADEAGYKATIAEYVAPQPVPLDTVAVPTTLSETTAQPGTQANCQVLVGLGIALCEPGQQVSFRGQPLVRPVNGPR